MPESDARSVGVVLWYAKGQGVGCGRCVCVCVCVGGGGGLRVYPDRLAINSMTVAVCLIVGALCK